MFELERVWLVWHFTIWERQNKHDLEIEKSIWYLSCHLYFVLSKYEILRYELLNKFVLVFHKSTFVVEASQKYDIGNWYSDLPYQIGKCL